MLCKKASAFLFMKTERLVLRSYTEKDKADFISLFTDAAVMKYVGDGVLTIEQAEAFWSKLFEKLYPQNFKIWAVFTNEGSRYVGHAGIYPRPARKEDWEFVYFLRPEAWGKGYATEIARKIIEYGFEELKLSEVFATVDDEHLASIRVLGKAGMSFEKFEFDESGRFSVYSVRR
jgi:RimJ/RimL family protein N-acetyltransferase